MSRELSNAGSGAILVVRTTLFVCLFVFSFICFFVCCVVCFSVAAVSIVESGCQENYPTQVLVPSSWSVQLGSEAQVTCLPPWQLHVMPLL